MRDAGAVLDDLAVVFVNELIGHAEMYGMTHQPGIPVHQAEMCSRIADEAQHFAQGGRPQQRIGCCVVDMSDHL
jgi:hypothetical protein